MPRVAKCAAKSSKIWLYLLALLLYLLHRNIVIETFGFFFFFPSCLAKVDNPTAHALFARGLFC